MRFFHRIINHKFEFSRNGIHINSVESFWETLKRGVYGIYHHISLKYLQRYIDEFSFRYNHQDNNAFYVLLIGVLIHYYKSFNISKIESLSIV
ncbi:transposase [Brevinema andersonii]|uniref:transposase n=1 Tax=Brevinema andersonii TaxID=34097 RepID=UPI0013564DA7